MKKILVVLGGGRPRGNTKIELINHCLRFGKLLFLS